MIILLWFQFSILLRVMYFRLRCLHFYHYWSRRAHFMCVQWYVAISCTVIAYDCWWNISIESSYYAYSTFMLILAMPCSIHFIRIWCGPSSIPSQLHSHKELFRTTPQIQGTEPLSSHRKPIRLMSHMMMTLLQNFVSDLPKSFKPKKIRITAGDFAEKTS